MTAIRIQRKREQIQDRLDNDNVDDGTRDSLRYTLSYLEALEESITQE